MFAKRHYETIADVLREVSTNMNTRASADLTVTMVRTKLIEAFQRDNPRFDSVRFLIASTPKVD